ncbi:MAG: N-acetylglutamate synthase [Phototrophicales bacterium]|nr:MAG: N-acetylglutamate synthase [Phototrophicales bacterium]RMG72398.1 MAG: GNAT family N-acetyltransferase [Chloroflexota bacterium]
MDIIIRKATQADIPNIIEFIRPFVEEGKLLPRTYDEIDEWMDSFFVAIHDDVIVGCAALEVYSKKLAEVRSLAVSPTMQGKGVGKMLVKACVDLARERNILEVMAISSSELFFRSCGFDFTLPGEKKAFFLQTRDEA